MGEVVREFKVLAPKAVEKLEAGFEDAMAVMALLESIRRRLRTIDAAKRLNWEIRRQERIGGIFPYEEAALGLIGAVRMEVDEAWATGHRYLDMTEYWIWRDKQERVESEKTNKKEQQAA